MVSIQGGASLAKQLFPLVGAQGATLLRLFFASVMLLILWRPWRARLKRQEILSLLVYGGSLGAMNLTFYMALHRLPLGITVAIEFIGPLSIAFAASRKALDFVWALLAMAGIAAILPLPLTQALSPESLDPVGIAYAAAAGGFWALYILFGKRVGATVPTGVATSLGMIAAMLVSLPFGIMEGGGKLLDPSILPIAVAVAFLSSALPYSFEMIAMKRMRTQSFGILMSLEPAIAALLGLVLLGEHLSVLQWVAIACIITASFGSAASETSAQLTPTAIPL